MTRGAPQPVGSLDQVTRYKIWKEQHVPLLYDWLSSRKLVWPHAAVQWGSLSDDESPRGRERPSSSTPAFATRALYLAERTGSSKSDPNTLLHFEVRVVQELTNKHQEVAKPWLEEAVVNERVDQMSTRDFWLRKRIVHPGEVNRIRLVGPDLVVTHSDSPQLFLWDFKRQPERKPKDTVPSTPSCTLVGHERNAEYALDVGRPNENNDRLEDTWIASGGRDCAVLIWRLSDYESQGQDLKHFIRMQTGPNKSPSDGHTDAVEDVSFNRADRQLLVSVGRDSAMALWDARSPSKPITVVHEAHDGDVNCCDYGGADSHRIITGGSDSIVRAWDRRFLKDANGKKKPSNTLYGHSDQITNVMWNRYVPDICASGSEDGQVLIWNVGEVDRRPVTTSQAYPNSHELIFRHVGHTMTESKIVDLEWHPCQSDPWCLATLSETVGEGGSTLQIWRISDLIYRAKEEVAADLRQHARNRVL